VAPRGKEKHFVVTKVVEPEVVVRAAEARLAEAFTRPPMGTQWAEPAKALVGVYIAERNQRVAQVQPGSSFIYLPRQRECPARILTTSKREVPQLQSNALDLASVYPQQARREGIEGSVIFGLQVSATGCLTGKTIVGSSGSEALDKGRTRLDRVGCFPAGGALRRTRRGRDPITGDLSDEGSLNVSWENSHGTATIRYVSRFGLVQRSHRQTGESDFESPAYVDCDIPLLDANPIRRRRRSY
jgi:hypothetical protein